MAVAARLVAGLLTSIAVSLATGALPAAHADPPLTAAGQHTTAAAQDLKVAITKLGKHAHGDDATIQPNRKLIVHGTVTNPGSTEWLDAQAYLQISTDPAKSLANLQAFARVPDNLAPANLIDAIGLFDEMGDIAPGHRVPFLLKVPYDALGISDEPGVYRVGVKVVAGTIDGRNPDDAAYASTLMPLLPSGPNPISAAQTVTLVPLSAPVKRLAGGAFADDSLRTLVSATGRLTNVVDWVLLAPPGTVQVVVDPALLAAITDMSNGYVVEPTDPTKSNLPGAGRFEAQLWLQKFGEVEQQQHVMLMPWGEPAANSLLANHVPGPVIASVAASRSYRDRHARGDFVAGWLTNGSSGIRAVSALQNLGVDLQIVAQDSLPGLASYSTTGRYVPSQVSVTAAGRQVSILVAGAQLAGVTTTSATSALQFRQRLIADATVRSLEGRTDVITIAALPFIWNPGQVKDFQGLAQAFELPVVVAQTAVGALDRPGVAYRGAVRPSPTVFRALGPGVVDKIRELRRSGGTLAVILSSRAATNKFQRAFAMSGSAQWRLFPLTGIRLITAEITDAQVALSKVRITGPPFVAMSSDSGRFPLTVTNGLDRPITVSIAVRPADPALSIQPIEAFQVDAGRQRDVQVVATAAGSGVTSVRAKVATPAGAGFGRPWRFDVRSTQIGLVIWIVMGVGGAILFTAAGYRIVNRIRGNETGRRQAPT
jgi:hypothetical protein